MRKPNPFAATAWIAAGVLVGSAFAFPMQTGFETMRLRGEILAEGGGPLAGARIRTDALRGPSASQFAGQKEFTARTGRNGDWSLLGVTRGLWILEVSALDYLPHVVVVPIAMMIAPDPIPWETSLALQAESAIVPPGAATNAPARLVVLAAERVLAGDKLAARQALHQLAESYLDAAALCAAGDVGLLLREAGMARRFFELAASANAKWYRPQLGIASAAMMAFDIDRAAKGYAAARSLTDNEKLQRMLSAAIRDLQQIRDRRAP